LVVGQNKPALVALRARREGVIDALSNHFACDALDLDEFEQRVDLAHRATSVAELDQLLRDLEPAATETSSTTVVAGSDVPPGAVAPRRRKAGRVVTVLSSVQRKGTWLVPRKMRVLTVMGAVDLDFRDARFEPGVTEVKLTSVMGAIAIVVPPGLNVECNGAGILGHFEELDTGTAEQGPDAPLLRITGFAVMGAVEMSTRPPGDATSSESSANAGEIGKP